MDDAMALMWPGVPLIDCAIMRPFVSNMPQAKSWLSRTIVLKAVLMSASCCSLATERKRFQITSKVTGSIASLFIGKFHDDVQTRINMSPASRADHDRGFALLDTAGTLQFRARLERISVIDGGLHVSAALGKKGTPSSLSRAACPGWVLRQLDARCRSRTTGNNPPIDQFQRHFRSFTAVKPAVSRLEGRGDSRQMLRSQLFARQSHRDFVP